MRVEIETVVSYKRCLMRIAEGFHDTAFTNVRNFVVLSVDVADFAKASQQPKNVLFANDDTVIDNARCGQVTRL